MKDTLTSFLGDDNFLKVNAFGCNELYLKVECFNPAGSIKFKTALGLIDSVEKSGRIDDDTILIESSSGNLGVSLSMICAQRRYRFVCVVDPNTNQQSIALMRAMGAEVICVDQPDENGGFLGMRLKYIRDLIQKNQKYIWLNQYENPANPNIHEKTTAPAIDREFDRLDYVFIGVGTSGTLNGCLRYFQKARPATKIVAVDSIGSVTFGLPAGRRYIPGLGSSQPPRLFHSAGLHALVAIPEAATIATCRQLAREHGFLAGGSTGTVLSAIQSWRQHFSPSDVVVAIAPDGGERYLSTIFNDDWVRERFGPGPLSSPPDEFIEAGAVMLGQQACDVQEVSHA